MTKLGIYLRRKNTDRIKIIFGSNIDPKSVSQILGAFCIFLHIGCSFLILCFSNFIEFCEFLNASAISFLCYLWLTAVQWVLFCLGQSWSSGGGSSFGGFGHFVSKFKAGICTRVAAFRSFRNGIKCRFVHKLPRFPVFLSNHITQEW